MRIIAACALALLASHCAHACAHLTRWDILHARFIACRDAPPNARRQCEADYARLSIQLFGGVRK